MKLLQILTELLDSKIDFEIIKATATNFQTKAIINKRKITFWAVLNNGDDGEYWDVSFGEQSGKLGEYTYDSTGSGSALKVFAMIKTSAEELIDRYSPNQISFSAENKTRTAIYRKMLIGFKNYTVKEVQKDDTVLFWCTAK